MLQALASADSVQWLSILVKAVAYAATLLAAGSVLVLVTMRSLDAANRRVARRVGLMATALAAIFSALRIPVRASFLTGGTWDGATDPILLGMVIDSPLGSSVGFRLVGLGLILALALPHRFGLWAATAGAVLVCGSFALRGHALEDPSGLLGLLITLHLLGLAFWIGAFAPLIRAARFAEPAQVGQMAHEFGHLALWVVAGLVIAGALTFGILTGWSIGALLSPYGQVFALKLAVFAVVLGLAGWNRFRLTPALGRGDTGAAASLRRSIRVEAALIGVILLTTAALTTLTRPPRADTATQTAAPERAVPGADKEIT